MDAEKRKIGFVREETEELYSYLFNKCAQKSD